MNPPGYPSFSDGFRPFQFLWKVNIDQIFDYRRVNIHDASAEKKGCSRVVQQLINEFEIEKDGRVVSIGVDTFLNQGRNLLLVPIEAELDYCLADLLNSSVGNVQKLVHDRVHQFLFLFYYYSLLKTVSINICRPLNLSINQ